MLVSGVRKIAVLRANALGDYLFSLPALEALRAAYPPAELTLLCAPWHARELSGRPGPVDRFVAVPPVAGLREPNPDEPVVEAGAFLNWARAERFDLAIQLHGGGRHSNPFIRELGAGLTAGLRADDAPPLDRWLRYVYYQPEVFRYLEVVGLVGAMPVRLTPHFPVTDVDRDEVRLVVGDPRRPRVALHPGVTDPRRQWPLERFAELGDALAAAGCEVVVTGTSAEHDLVERVCLGIRGEAPNLAGALTLGGLAALYAGCAVVVANDTGPLHLAGAVGAGTVGLYWVGNMINGAPPTRTRHRPIASWRIHCPQCGVDCTRDIYPYRGGDAGCAHHDSFLTDIPVAEVLHETRELLASSGALARTGVIGPSSVAAAGGSAASIR
jgi:ADP-heptose:LPS heptosyltransferase